MITNFQLYFLYSFFFSKQKQKKQKKSNIHYSILSFLFELSESPITSEYVPSMSSDSSEGNETEDLELYMQETELEVYLNWILKEKEIEEKKNY